MLGTRGRATTQVAKVIVRLMYKPTEIIILCVAMLGWCGCFWLRESKIYHKALGWCGYFLKLKLGDIPKVFGKKKEKILTTPKS